MHYENISKLIDALQSTFAQQGYVLALRLPCPRAMPYTQSRRYYWTCQGELMREQQSTFRVNCIDCLDRTAVVLALLVSEGFNVAHVAFAANPPSHATYSSPK